MAHVYELKETADTTNRVITFRTDKIDRVVASLGNGFCRLELNDTTLICNDEESLNGFHKFVIDAINIPVSRLIMVYVEEFDEVVKYHIV